MSPRDATTTPGGSTITEGRGPGVITTRRSPRRRTGRVWTKNLLQSGGPFLVRVTISHLPRVGDTIAPDVILVFPRRVPPTGGPLGVTYRFGGGVSCHSGLQNRNRRMTDLDSTLGGATRGGPSQVGPAQVGHDGRQTGR